MIDLEHTSFSCFSRESHSAATIFEILPKVASGNDFFTIICRSRKNIAYAETGLEIVRHEKQNDQLLKGKKREFHELRTSYSLDLNPRVSSWMSEPRLEVVCYSDYLSISISKNARSNSSGPKVSFFVCSFETFYEIH
ncbi:unnamed protein product [Cylicocyclus nassatus]|uniref:Uncharacterized protein n=1 Tax=Cylicocyclus nassatus TaxID=53992 RepID=A0AA36GMW7_CYLNA|nr:unnamed protein product [Cylicocyclus nassatus]